jgi:hypothetical protein
MVKDFWPVWIVVDRIALWLYSASGICVASIAMSPDLWGSLLYSTVRSSNSSNNNNLHLLEN